MERTEWQEPHERVHSEHLCPVAPSAAVEVLGRVFFFAILECSLVATDQVKVVEHRETHNNQSVRQRQCVSKRHGEEPHVRDLVRPAYLAVSDRLDEVFSVCCSDENENQASSTVSTGV